MPPGTPFTGRLLPPTRICHPFGELPLIGSRYGSMKAEHVLLALAVMAVIALLAWAAFPKPWMGFTDNHELIGSYYSLAACKKDVGKRGGWCGKGCMQYPSGSIANCDPLIEVSK
jgi:hypothetical protein